MEGIVGIKPGIKKIVWHTASAINFYLEDGRIITMPIKLLPSVKKTKLSDRKKAMIMNDGTMFTWDTCPEVYHIEQILGKEKDYKYR
jgi:hypothetical protein